MRKNIEKKIKYKNMNQNKLILNNLFYFSIKYIYIKN